MQSHHWFSLLIVAVIFYVVGAKWPMLANRIGAGN